jgi:negative regulator of flagellin synthesis FlgM
MPNRIQGSDTSSVDVGTSRTIERLSRVAPPSSPTSQTTAQSASVADSVSITDTARRLASLQEAVAGTPEIDAGRVATISNAIQQGHYSPDPAKIADRLMQLESDLNAASRRQKS